jgi:hypothetical protein
MTEHGSPFDLSHSGDSLESRQAGEVGARGIVDGRVSVRRKTRTEQVALKTSVLKAQQFAHLSLRMNASKIEVFEAALDALQRELDAEATAATAKKGRAKSA